jgi:hypothetical protein
MNPEPNNPPPTTDLEKAVVKMLKDIEWLKQKVSEIETGKLVEHFHLTPEEVKEQFITAPPTRVGTGLRGSRPLLESEIKEALEHLECMAAVARYLGVSGKTFKKYAKRYNLYKPNPTGKGAIISKQYHVNSGKYPLDKILAGEIVHPTPWKLKQLLLRGGIKTKQCERCSWKEPRVDGVHPFVINFVDGDPTNQKLENMKIYCHNCTFVLRGYIRRGVVVFDDIPST